MICHTYDFMLLKNGASAPAVTLSCNSMPLFRRSLLTSHTYDEYYTGTLGECQYPALAASLHSEHRAKSLQLWAEAREQGSIRSAARPRVWCWVGWQSSTYIAPVANAGFRPGETNM